MMGQTRGEIDQILAERLCWQAARRDDARVARRLYRKQVVDGVYRLYEGAWLDDFFYVLHELGIVNWLDNVKGAAIQRDGPLRPVCLALCPDDVVRGGKYECPASLAVEGRDAHPSGRFQCAARAAGRVSAGCRETAAGPHEGADLSGA